MDEQPPVQRRLAAILAADIAGYSRLMHEDEPATVRDLKAHQSVILPLIGRHGGRIIDTAGDGILAEFPSVIGATECAVEIQSLMAERNEGVAASRRMRFRIGINLGDVIHDETRIYGDGINIAARLEALAQPGGVLVSNTVYDQVRHKLPFTFEDLGERQVKNIEQPVRMYQLQIPGVPSTAVTLGRRPTLTARRRWIVWGLAAVLLGAGGTWWIAAPFFASQRANSTEAPRLSIVVLPFSNLSGDPSQDYFADGITEDLTSDLSRIAGSFVISRNTAFTFKGKAVDARQIGRELGVRYVLEGSVRRMGGTVRVNAQLIDAGTGAHLWAEQMDVDQGTLATLQDNFGIANRLARTLSVELVNVEGRRAPRADPDALDLTMRGWSVLNGGPNKDDAQRAVALFEDALRIDPDSSQARVGLAQALTLIYRNRWDPEPATVLARADEAATRAIAVAPNYAHAHYVKAEVLGLSNRFDAALATYDRAIALDPNHAAAHVGRARNLNVIGRAADALAPVERAIRLSPRDPELYVWYFVLCHANTHLARDAQAIEWCLKSLATGKTFYFAYVDLAAAYAWRGQNAEAAAAVAELLKLRPGYTMQTLVQEGSGVSDHPAFRKEFQRIVEGARKAGLPES
ncbi:MAG TPA: adenylate/guanylate cyclase domain-containing protein [Methylomirabilota bacterium]|nr:adenylate/guanylate cyclase domain-containing protein [Methylomirabilota bacterium]